MRAIALLSGGLDSSLATKMILDQGIEVIALKFTSPFCNCDSGGTCHAANIAGELGIELINVPKGEEYLEIVRDPKHGRGSGMNACIDCRIFMLKKAKQIAEEKGASFMFTGEVLGQRPMSQHRRALDLIDKETGLEGKLLRPLSAKLLPPTEAEQNGWVDRSKLLSISGRGRKVQIELAEENGIVDYPCPAGGCLLTSKEFSAKLRDLLEHDPDRLTMRDIGLIKVGRHFRVNGMKVIIGRNEKENVLLKAYLADGLSLIEPIAVKGPTAIIEGDDPETVRIAASMVARYSDNLGRSVRVRVIGKDEMEQDAEPSAVSSIDRFRIGAEEDLVIGT